MTKKEVVVDSDRIFSRQKGGVKLTIETSWTKDEDGNSHFYLDAHVGVPLKVTFERSARPLPPELTSQRPRSFYEQDKEALRMAWDPVNETLTAKTDELSQTLMKRETRPIRDYGSNVRTLFEEFRAIATEVDETCKDLVEEERRKQGLKK